MSQIHVIARLALWSLAALASSAAAQQNPGVPGRGNEGQIFGPDDDVQSCQTSGGGSRVKANCETEPETVRTEQQLRITIKPPTLPGAECDAAISTSYHQRNTVARVESTIQVAACGAASGEHKVTLRIRDESGVVQTLEFDETWQRNDDKSLSLTDDYPIGENVELVSARVRGASCTCAKPPEAAVQASEPLPEPL